jgi:hypothetical protein
LTQVWVPHDVRDLVVDFVRCWSEKTEIGAGRFIHWLGVRASKFYDWRERYGRVNEHNGWVPRDFWLALWERQAIIHFHWEHPLWAASNDCEKRSTTRSVWKRLVNPLATEADCQMRNHTARM